MEGKIMATPAEQLLDELSTIMDSLNRIRKKLPDADDRAAVASQVAALGKWWTKIDEQRARESYDGVQDDIKALSGIDDDLKKERQKLTKVADVVHDAAITIGLAEKVFKFLA